MFLLCRVTIEYYSMKNDKLRIEFDIDLQSNDFSLRLLTVNYKISAGR